MPDMTQYSKNYRRFIDVDALEGLLKAPFDAALFATRWSAAHPYSPWTFAKPRR